MYSLLTHNRRRLIGVAYAPVLALLIFPMPLNGNAQISASGLENLARRLLSEGLPDSALAVAESLLATDSTRVDLWILKSEIHAARGERTEEITALRQALVQSPFRLKVHLLLARAFLDLGLIDSAASYLALPLRHGGRHEVETIYLQGRIREHQGKLDSAVLSYRRVYEILDARELVHLPIGAGEKLSTIPLYSPTGHVSRWNAGAPTIFLLWASWSPSSEQAMEEIATRLSRSGISWRFVPLNVDAGNPSPPMQQQMQKRARELGYTDSVWIDRELSLFRNWGITCVPTVIFVSLDGEIDAVETGWSDTVRDRVLNGFMGGPGDTLQAPAASADTNLVRARRLFGTARQFWNAGHFRQAMRQASQATRAAPTFAMPHLQLAVWRWQRGDTLGARMAAYEALSAYSASPWANFVVALVERHHGRSATAANLLQRTVSLDSEFVPAWSVLGIDAAISGDQSTAQKVENVLLRLNAVDPGLAVLRAITAENDDSEKAAAAWRRAVEAHL